MYYATIGLLAILVLLAENQGVLFKWGASYEAPSWKAYRLFLFAILVYYATDVAWGFLEECKLGEALFIDTTAYFIAMAISVLLWAKYTVSYLDDEGMFGRFLQFAGRLFCCLVIALAVVNIFYPVLFRVDEQCVYHGTFMRNVQLVIQIVLLFLTSAYALGAIRRVGDARRRRYRTIALFGLITGIFLTSQIWFPYLPFYTVGYMLGTCLLHAYVIGDEREEYRLGMIAERMEEGSAAYARINALAGDYICIYMVGPETDRFREYSATEEYEALMIAKEGDDFFESVVENGREVVYPDDLELFLSRFTRENVFAEIERSGLFTLRYRILLDGSPIYVMIKAAMVEEKDGPCLIVGINNVDSVVRQEEEYAAQLSQAQIQASQDALTGVKNRRAYLSAEDQLDRQIEEHRDAEFAVVIFDVNDLKVVNDTLGHQAGDQYLRDACKIVCDVFNHSPVFRVGGDEFAVIAQDGDYARIDDLVAEIAEHNAQAAASGGIVIACGMARYDNDTCVAEVFERADLNMYVNKNVLKGEEIPD